MVSVAPLCTSAAGDMLPQRLIAADVVDAGTLTTDPHRV
jgi:hypothetical protein